MQAHDIDIVRKCFHVMVNNFLGSVAAGIVQVKENGMDARYPVVFLPDHLEIT